MKKVLLTILLFCLSACGGDNKGGGAQFVQKASFPDQVTISEQISFSIGNKGYLIVPNIIGVSGPGKVWEFDPFLNQWTRKNDHPGITFQSPNFVANNKAIIISGNTVWEYDPVSDQWAQKKDAPGADKRAGFAFSIGNNAYVGGGFYNGNNFYRYDVSNDSWSQVGNHPNLGYDPSYPSIGGITFVINSKGYVTGTNMGFWEYNPAQDTWAQKASIDAGYGQAFSIGGKGYVFNALGEMAKYDETTDSWNTVATFPGRNIYYPAGFAINGVAYLGVGQVYPSNGSTDYSYDFWAFMPNYIRSPMFL